MSNIQTSSPLLTVKDVMERLKISRKTLYNLRNAGKISAVLVNDSVRFTEQEIERFIKDSLETHS
jgi:excisionase family DNA binding protein